jgi:hypothetical protein
MRNSAWWESGFSIEGDFRKMHLIELEGEALLLCMPNNGTTQIFQHGKSDKQ